MRTPAPEERPRQKTLFWMRGVDLVDFNSNGMCIESKGKVFRNDRWIARYIVCKKPPDLTAPVFMVYKNASKRKSNRMKYSVGLQSYVGIESSFELRRQSHTLAVITKDQIIILAFAELKHVIMWEAWLRSACGQSHCFYVQLQGAPNNSKAHKHILKEDSYMALVCGRPQEVLEFAYLKELRIYNRTESKFAFTTNSMQSPSDCYSLFSARLDMFYKMFEHAIEKNGLHLYLSRSQYEGDWIGMYVPEEKRKVASRAHSESYNAVYSSVRGLVTHSGNGLDKQRSKSGHFFQSEQRPSDALCRATSVASYKSLNMPREYINLSRASSVHSKTVGDDLSLQSNITRGTSEHRSIGRLHQHQQPPEQTYINLGDGTPPDEPRETFVMRGSPSKLSIASEMKENSPKEARGRRRSDNSVTSASHAFIKRRYNNLSKQRSMMEFTDQEEFLERYENWKKAKRFISAFKPRDAERPDLSKSSSTGALIASGNPFNRSSQTSEHLNSFISQLDVAAPPQLNVSIAEAMNPTTSSALKDDQRPPQGLVRPNEEYVLNARGGVGALLARRLASSVRGSYSKYDGDRTSHQYTVNIPTRVDETNESHPDDPLAGVDSAIARSQERMRENDRRSSAISFSKSLLLLPSKISKSSKTRDKEKAEKEKKSLFQHLTSPRNSASLSESTRSSNDSLSSDARSKISIKKRAVSPPNVDAPRLNRPVSNTTITLPPVSSMDSLNSEQTTRSQTTPPLLPKRVTKKKSSSSSPDSSPENRASATAGSSTAALDYCVLSKTMNPSTSTHSLCDELNYMVVDQESTQAIKNANLLRSSLDRELSKSTTISPRKISQGEKSTVSETLSFGTASRHGFFRKYRKMRRDKKDAASLNQLDIQ